jgi:GT2 family glycosyltransferase
MSMERAHIVAVIVLYKLLPERSPTLNSVMEAFAAHPELSRSIRLLVWDNSPKAIEQLNLPFPCVYTHAARNVGTSGAYNYAMEFAEGEGCPWLLLLDQDTTVSDNFLPRMLEYSHLLLQNAEVGSVVPFIFSHGSLISPRRLGRFNQVHPISQANSGVYRGQAFAVNSATLMKVSALREIGGYSDEFWLDLSDVYVFQAMYRKGKHLYIAGDLSLQHSITSMDFDRDMAPERYQNFLSAEGAFVDLNSSLLDRGVYLFRLLVRATRQRRRYKNKIFAKITREYLWRRLLDGKPKRLQSWRKQLQQRDIPAIENGRVIG